MSSWKSAQGCSHCPKDAMHPSTTRWPQGIRPCLYLHSWDSWDNYFKSTETSSRRDLRSENSGQASQLLKKLMKTTDQSPGRCPSMYTQYCHTTSEQPWTPLPPPLPPNTTMESVEFLAVHPRSPCPDLGHLPHCLDDKWVPLPPLPEIKPHACVHPGETWVNFSTMETEKKVTNA